MYKISPLICMLLLSFVVFTASAEAPLESTTTASQNNTRPNLLWIVLDASRATNFSCYGNAHKTTPHIDQLAERGLLCENNFTQGNNTFTSVPSYMSGSYFPPDIFYNAPWEALWRTPPEGQVLFPSVMKANGYQTVLVTGHGRFSSNGRLWPLFDDAFRVRYSPAFTTGPGTGAKTQTPMGVLVDTSLDWIERHKDAPFFCYLHAVDTHFPHYIEKEPYTQWLDTDHPEKERLRKGNHAPVKWDNRSAAKASNPQRFSKKDQAYIQGLHDGSLFYCDEQIGRMLQRLEALKLLENTIIVISSDHGDALGEDGVTINHHTNINTDEVHHVPLIIAGPNVPKNRRLATLTENTDIAPTLIDIMKLQSEAVYDGLSLKPLFDDTKAALSRKYIFMRPGATLETGTNLLFVLRDTAFKYARSPFTGEEYLWTVPDLLLQRQEVSTAHPDKLAEMRSYLDAHIMPRYEEYKALPLTSPNLVYMTINPHNTQHTPGNAAVRKENPTDDKWFFRNAFLASAPQENAPPITLSFSLPQWTFRVTMVLRVPKGETTGAIRIKAQEDSEFRQLSIVSDVPRAMAVEVGTYEVENTFQITVDDPDDAQWAIVESFFFYPVKESNAPAADENEILDRQEQLKALGYLE